MSRFGIVILSVALCTFLILASFLSYRSHAHDERHAALSQKLSDIEEIRQLHLDYAAFNETQDLEGLLSLFTSDAVLHYGPDYGGDWSGREVIRKNFSYWMKQEGSPFSALYVLTNPRIVITSENTAFGRWTFTNYLTQQVAGSDLVTIGGQNQPLYILGLYEDEYRRVNGRWKISDLKLGVLWPKRNFTELKHAR